MAVTHNLVLVVSGVTISAQSDFVVGQDGLVKMDTDEITIDQQRKVLDLISCISGVGNKFGAVITSLSVTAI